jgi:hypothetical protein
MTYDDDFRKFRDELKKQLDIYADMFSIYWIILNKFKTNIVYKGKNWETYSKSINDNLLSDDGSDDYSFSVIIVSKIDNLQFILTEPFGDFMNVFDALDYEIDPETGAQKLQTNPYSSIVFHNLWNRHTCLLKSSLVNGTMNNYLGYSNVRYSPLRYYRITNDDSKFYIDLFNGHEHPYPSILSPDNRDCITVEMVMIQ